MEINAQEQLSYSIHQAEQQVEQGKSRPDANPNQIATQEKEVQILKKKLELLPRTA